MNKRFTSVASAAVIAAATLSACGGGDSGVDPGVTGVRQVSGVITGFGSVFVNGVEYETDTASVTVDGASGLEDDLQVGMVVTLEGKVNADGTTGIASAIQFADEAEGPVLANNVAVDGTLDVMGQTVVVDTETRFESNVATVLAPADIQAGNIVEVSGHSSGTGTIYATRIEVKAAARGAGDEIEVKGTVSGLDAAARTFNLGSLTVDYSQAQLDDGTPVDGWYVEVKSTSDIAGGTLVADKVELEDEDKGHDGEEGEETELQGIVTLTTELPAAFELNGQRVLLDGDTEFEHGSVDALVDGLRIEVEGRFDADGVLVAEEIKLKSEADIELQATVEAVDAAAGTVTLLGQSFGVGTATMMVDERDEGVTPVRYFSLADLYVGDSVELKAYRDPSTGALVATALERDDADPAEVGTVELQGPVESLPSANQAVIAGVTLDLSAVSGLTIAVGDELEVAGTYSGGVLAVASAELDD